MTEQTGRFDAQIQSVQDEMGALEHEAAGLRDRIRELQMRERYEPQKVAAEGGTKPLTSRLVAIGRERNEGETRLLELRIRRLMRDSQPARAEQQAARENITRIGEEGERLKQEHEAASDRHIRATWAVNAYDDRIRELWRELRQRRGEGG